MLLATLDGHAVGKLLYVVGVALVPFGKASQIVGERIERLHIVALDDTEEVLHCGTVCLRHLAPQGVDRTVVDDLPKSWGRRILSGAFSLHAILHPHGNLVVPQIHVFAQKPDDVVHGSRLARLMATVLQLVLALAVLLSLTVATVHDSLRALVVGKLLADELQGGIGRETESIELVGEARHILVLAARHISLHLLLQFLGKLVFVEAVNLLHLPSQSSRGIVLQGLLLLPCHQPVVAESFGIRTEEGIRVVGGTHQSAQVAAMLVVLHAQQVGEILVAMEEGSGIELHLLLQRHARFHLVAIEYAQSLTRSGDVEEQSVPVLSQLGAELG